LPTRRSGTALLWRGLNEKREGRFRQTSSHSNLIEIKFGKKQRAERFRVGAAYSRQVIMGGLGVSEKLTAAVDDQRLAGHERCKWRGQEQCRTDHVIRSRRALDRAARDAVTCGILHQAKAGLG
jgi:hypothetical protein